MDRIMNAGYLPWLLAHLDDLQPLLDLVARFEHAKSLEERWEIIRTAIDVLVKLLASFPTTGQHYAAAGNPTQLSVNGFPIDWERLLELLVFAVRLIELIRKGGVQ